VSSPTEAEPLRLHDDTQVLPLNRSPRPLSSRAAILLALPLALPLLTIVFLALNADPADWSRMMSGALPAMARDTLLFCAGVAAGTLLIGTLLAYAVTMFRFPGRDALSWLAILPLAVPGYITAFAYVDTFSYAGSFQFFLRDLFGWRNPADYWFPEIRSLGGAIFVMSFVLYPYVYVAARVAFLRQPQAQLDAARTLGRSRLKAFLEITLPQARPALAVGMALVVMECLNDIGAVGFFGVNTVTYGIFSLWLGEGNLGAATQLAMLLLMSVAALVLFEQAMRRRDALSRSLKGRMSADDQPALTGARAALAVLTAALPVFFGFILPVLLLIDYAGGHWSVAWSPGFAAALGNSVLLALIAAAGTVALALAFGYANRRSTGRGLRWVTQFVGLGYALPGTVLAIGILVPFGLTDRWINWAAQGLWGASPGLILSGSIAALAFAYITRFLAISLGSVEAGLQKAPATLDDAARSLGRRPLRVFGDIHLPLLRPVLLSAALLVFVDAMKELPATLMLRPFDFETLATHVFSLASIGQFEDSAVPALTIVAVGLIPVAILTRSVRDADR
jgi:iron(III) transport system permease protein